MAPGPVPLEPLRVVIVAQFPELASARFELLPRGWDSAAVDVDGRLIFKFPRHEEAEKRLRLEARVLTEVRPNVTMPVPDSVLFETPRTYTRHTKLVGDYLLPEAYEAMTEAGKDRCCGQLAEFYAQIHALDPARMRAAGAGPIGAWRTHEAIEQEVLPLLPDALRPAGVTALAAFGALTPDPYGEPFGFFDGHSWNMAFDPEAERVTGVYDFGDCGFGPLHQEFIYSNFIGFDATRRIMDHYEALTGRVLDRERVRLFGGLHILSEFTDNPDYGAVRFARWVDDAGRFGRLSRRQQGRA